MPLESEHETLIVVADADRAAETAARLIADALVEAVAARGRADWATTGGSSAPGIYRRLAAAPHVERVPWDRVHVWWGDDRYVTPDDTRSNVGPLHEHLLGAGVPLPAANIHPFRGLPSGESDPGISAAAEATALDLHTAGIDGADGIPVFDVVVLGMGADAHILSVFPGSAALGATAPVLAIPAPSHIEPHVARLTMNPAIVGAARLVLPVVTGETKAGTLGDVLGPVHDPALWPAQLARVARATWIVDEAAAGQVPGGSVGASIGAAVASAAPVASDGGTPASPQPVWLVPSRDGTQIAVFASGPVSAPPVILVHGAAADHTTFRVVGPLIAKSFRVFELDRRGRGASGDGPSYAIEREFEDLATVAEAVAAVVAGAPAATPPDTTPRVDVIGHSYGGRIALGATLLTTAIGRVVSYEGAPSAPGMAYHDAETEQSLARLIADGQNDAALELFMRVVVGMPDPDLAAYRADAIWSRRAAAAPTVLREIIAERSPAASLVALAAVRNPVLQILGGASHEVFASATRALDARLSDGRIVIIPGARHAAHHTHADAFVAAIATFLTR